MNKYLGFVDEGQLASTPQVGNEGGVRFFPDCCLEHQFNSILRKLSETIDKWVWLMCGLMRSENLHAYVAYFCIITTITTSSNHVSLFLELKKNILICLHLSSFAYAHLVNLLHSTSFVYDSSSFIYTRLHSSSDLYLFLEYIQISIYRSLKGSGKMFEIASI